MRPGSLRYLLREGFRSLWQNRFMAVASVMVLVSCLMMIGAAFLIFVNIDNAFNWVYEQNVVVASVKEDCTGERLTQLQALIEGVPNVSKVTFLSKAQSLEKLRDSLPDAVYQSIQGDNNPILDSFVITFADLAQFDQTVGRIRELAEVENINYSADLAKTLTYVRSMVWTVGIWVVGILFLVSMFIISNTIKLTLYSRRLEIYIMKSVGATNWFIRVPFIVEGIVIGLLSGGVGYGLLNLVYSRIPSPFGFGAGLVRMERVYLPILIGFLAIGFLTGLTGSAISLGRYLRKQGGIADE